MSFSPPKLDYSVQSGNSSQSQVTSNSFLGEDVAMEVVGQSPNRTALQNNQYVCRSQMINQKKQFNKKFTFSQNENMNPNAQMHLADQEKMLSEKLNENMDKIKTKSQKQIDKLQAFPSDLQLYIILFLSPKDLVFNVQMLSVYWKQYAKNPQLWGIFNRYRPLTVGQKLQITHCLVERRSKGKLYIAQDRISQEKKSLRKIYLDVTNAGQDDGLPTSILREISHLKSLEHPNVIRIEHAEVVNEKASLVYAYNEYNLKEYLKKFQRQPLTLKNSHPDKPPYIGLENIKMVMYQLLQGLAYCHRHGVMHRNLKPDNIFLSQTEPAFQHNFNFPLLKISDFALSRIAAFPHFAYTPEDPKERERSGRESRRLWYRAPELLFRKKFYSFEVDMWSAGCLLAEIALGGEPLFCGESEIEQLLKIFKFTGSPTNEVIQVIQDGSPESLVVNLPCWERSYFGNVCAPKGSPELESLIKCYVPMRETSLSKLMELSDRMGMLGVDLLWHLLDLNPQTRLSAEKALSHRFFDSVRAPCALLYNSLAPQENPLLDEPLASKVLISNYSGEMPVEHYQYLAKQLHRNEMRLRPKPNFLQDQKHITENMRSILIDWLVDVSVHFEVMGETLHFAISFTDRTLSLIQIEKSKLQLVGVACMKIADLFNEKSKEYYRQENANEYSYITADEYPPSEIILMEKSILNLMDFDLNCPTSLTFLKLYNQVFEHSPRVLITALYLADLMLLPADTHLFPPSLLASAYLFLSLIAHQEPILVLSSPLTVPQDQSSEKMKKATELFGAWYNQEEFTKCANHVRRSWTESKHNPNFSRFDAVNNKYEQYHETVNVRMIYPPLVSQTQFERWIYSETAGENQMILD